MMIFELILHHFAIYLMLLSSAMPRVVVQPFVLQGIQLEAQNYCHPLDQQIWCPILTAQAFPPDSFLADVGSLSCGDKKGTV